MCAGRTASPGSSLNVQGLNPNPLAALASRLRICCTRGDPEVRGQVFNLTCLSNNSIKVRGIVQSTFIANFRKFHINRYKIKITTPFKWHTAR